VRYPDVPTLSDGDVTLRAHRGDDIAAVHEQCVDPLSQQWTTVPVPYTLEDARSFVTDKVPHRWRDGSEWAFAVEADDNGVRRFAGTVALRDEGAQRAEIAYGSHPWARGRGCFVRALTLLLEWGFAEKDLETVIWQANKGNWSSRRLAWRVGFSFDGSLRRWLPQRGDLLDAWVGGLCRGDTLSPRSPWFDVPRITGQSVVLREHERKDQQRIQEACSADGVAHWLPDLPRPYTLASAETYLESRREAHAEARSLSWAVADPRSDELLANVTLFDIKPGDDAEIGYWTHPSAQRRGVMTEACGLVTRHAFVPVEDGGAGLRRLKVFTAEPNVASQRVVEANGFVRTGLHRADTRLGDGSWVDTVAYDLLGSEYTR
jgi:RimJ/RimL family protein N-acetyltransferase